MSTAHEYRRVSDDSSGREASPEQQGQDHAAERGEFGWAAGRVYSDVGSASRFAADRRGRDEFDRMVSDLRAGDVFGRGDVLQLWESSRGGREEEDWIVLLKLLRAAYVLVRVKSHRRTYDLHIARDWKSLMDDGITNAYRSAVSSEELLRSKAADAALGRPAGRLPFGYRRTYTNRHVVEAQLPDEVEAPLYAQMMRDLRAGSFLGSIESDWAERGITTRTGYAWTAQMIREMALNVLYRPFTSNPDEKRATRVHKGTEYAAIWPPLTDWATWHAVHDRLTDPTRSTTPTRRGKHLISLTAKCDVCSDGLTVSWRKKAHRYGCERHGHTTIRQADLDALAEFVVVEHIARPQGQRPPAAATNRAALAEVRRDLREARAEWRGLASSGMSNALAALREVEINARIDRLVERERDLSTPDELADLVQLGEKARQQWADLDPARRRRVARLVLSPAVCGELRLTRTTKRGPVTVPAVERVAFLRADGTRLTFADWPPAALPGHRPVALTGDPARRWLLSVAFVGGDTPELGDLMGT